MKQHERAHDTNAWPREMKRDLWSYETIAVVAVKEALGRICIPSLTYSNIEPTGTTFCEFATHRPM